MSEINYEENIGINIKKERLAKGWSQNKLGNECGIANTVISAYENGRKKPGLNTIAIIAQKLGVSIDRLCYGDENEAFINSVPDEGRKIVNCIYTLWEMQVIYYYENYIHSMLPYEVLDDKEKNGVFLRIRKYSLQIKRLIISLNDFIQKKETFPDPDLHLESILSSVANEINAVIVREKEEEGKKKQNG